MEITDIIINNVGTIIQSLINLLGIIAAGILIYNLALRLDANVQLDRIKKEHKENVNKFLEILIVINNDKNKQKTAQSKIVKNIYNKLNNLYTSIDPPKEYPISEMYLKVDSISFFETVLEFNNFYKKVDFKQIQASSFATLNELSESFIDKGIALYLNQLKISKTLHRHIPILISLIILDIFLFIVIYYIVIFQIPAVIIFNNRFDYLSILTYSNILALFCLLYTGIIAIYLLKIYKK